MNKKVQTHQTCLKSLVWKKLQTIYWQLNFDVLFSILFQSFYVLHSCWWLVWLPLTRRCLIKWWRRCWLAGSWWGPIELSMLCSYLSRKYSFNSLIIQGPTKWNRHAHTNIYAHKKKWLWCNKLRTNTTRILFSDCEKWLSKTHEFFFVLIWFQIFCFWGITARFNLIRSLHCYCCCCIYLSCANKVACLRYI